MRRQAALGPADPAASGRRFQHLQFPLQPARGREPLKPCGAGEIVGARQHRRRWRHEPDPQAHQCALPRAGAILCQRDVDPQLDRPVAAAVLVGPPCRQHKPHAAFGRLLDALEHPPFDLRTCGIRDRLRADHFRASPYQGRAGDKGEPQGHCRDPKLRSPFLAPPERQCAQCQQPPTSDRGNPLSAPRKAEPRRDSRSQGDCDPGAPIHTGPGQEIVGRIRHAGQAHAVSPRRLLQRSIRRSLPQGHARRIARRHGCIGKERTGYGKRA